MLVTNNLVKCTIFHLFKQHAASIRGNVCVCVSVCVNVCVCVCVISQFSTMFYDVTRLILMSPIDCWRHFTPFWCKASFCMTKIDNFRTQLSGTTELLQAFIDWKDIENIRVLVGNKHFQRMEEFYHIWLSSFGFGISQRQIYMNIFNVSKCKKMSIGENMASFRLALSRVILL